MGDVRRLIESALRRVELYCDGVDDSCAAMSARADLREALRLLGGDPKELATLRPRYIAALETTLRPRSPISEVTEPEHVNRQRLIETLADLGLRIRQLEKRS